MLLFTVCYLKVWDDLYFMVKSFLHYRRQLDRYAPQRDRTNKMACRLAKTQVSLGTRPVWSESSPCAVWAAKDPTFPHADSEDSDQTRRMPRLIWVFARRIGHFVGFAMHRLICLCLIADLIFFYFMIEWDLYSLIEWNFLFHDRVGSLPFDRVEIFISWLSGIFTVW